jgi:hypothetical protein
MHSCGAVPDLGGVREPINRNDGTRRFVAAQRTVNGSYPS